MTPVDQFIDRMNRLTLQRHAWISDAAAKVDRWRAEDEANGIFWNDSTRDGECANNGSPVNHGN